MSDLREKYLKDNLFRVSDRFLVAYGIPINIECWIRSGVTEIEIKRQTERIVDVNFTQEDLMNTIQLAALENYLTELIVDDVILKSERNTYVNRFLSTI